MEPIVQLCNQVCELEQKSKTDAALSGIGRNLNRMKHSLEQMGYRYHNPLGEDYQEERSDCKANLLDGSGNDDLYISKVLKPVVYKEEDGKAWLVQKAVVIVEAR